MERVVDELDTAEAERFFAYAGYRARNLRDPLRRAGAALLHHANLTFATERDWVGEPWPALSRKYETWKLGRVGARPMLVFSGHLRRDADQAQQTAVISPLGELRCSAGWD